MEGKNKKHIAFHISSMVKAGAQRVVYNLMNYYLAEGYQVSLVTIYQGEDEYELDERIERIYSDLTEEELSNSRIANFYNRVKKLKQIWKQIRPDAIVAFMGKTNMMALLSTIGMDIPVYVSVRSDPNREYYNSVLRFLSKNLFCRAAGVIVQTQDAYDYFPKRIKKKAKILPNPLNPQFIRERFEGEREPEIVTVGRIDKNKNHIMLIQAFAAVAKHYPEFRVVLYGDGEEKEKLERQVREMGLEERIVFAGVKTNTQDYLWKSRVFVLTSKVEGMPNVLLEAMALGLTVISTDCPCGGPRTVIRHEKNGLLIPVDDVEALEMAIRRVLDNPQFADELGKNAAQIGKDMAPDKVNRMWMDYIEQGMK